MHTSGDGRVSATENRGAGRTRRTATLWGAVVLATGLTFGGLSVPAASTADSSPTPGTPETVAADALPTVQIDGVVYAQEVVGNTVYVGGSFSKARPAGAAPGTNETPRANLLAYDLTTGALISSWNPGTNNTVLDIKKSADGSRIYVAGMFSQAAGAWRYRVAAFDTATGALVTNWSPAANGRIDGLAVTESAVYLAGEFTTVNGAQRTKVAAVSTADGAVTGFTADVKGGYGAKAVVVSPDRSKVVVSGSFTSVNGSTNPGRGITALNASTGTILPWAMNSLLRNGGASDKGYGIMYSLTSDGDSVYGTAAAHGYQEDGAAYEGAFRASWSDGRLIWMEDCHGDTYDIALASGAVYVAGHPHDCTNIGGFPESKDQPFKNSLAFSAAPTGPLITKDKVGGAYGNYEGQQAPSLLHWYPSYVPGTYTGQSQGPWQVTTSGDFVLIGGEFLKVNGTAQQGIVRFAKKSSAPNKQGPQEQGSNWKLTASAGKVGNKLTWTANFDRDNQNLTYQVFRQDKGTTVPVYETTRSSSFWVRPSMSFIDATGVPGTTYNYRIKAIDAHGNSTQSDWTPFTTLTAADTAYDSTVLSGSPTSYWPLNQNGAAIAKDLIVNNGLVVSAATGDATGPITTAAGSTSTKFAGTTASSAGAKTTVLAPGVFTIEAWFKTSSTTGGAIMGFNVAQSGNAGTHDRDVYLDNTGRVTFGVWKGSQQTITSAAGFNDAAWHHVVASVGTAGQSLYIDGALIGVHPNVTSADPYTGYWRVGGTTTTGWANAGSSSFLEGSIAHVAVYDRALPTAEIMSHRAAALGIPNAAPVAAFTPTAAGLAVAVDGSATTDPDGVVRSYAWAFGDGGTAVGTTASHTYTTAGTYAVTLTVTDDKGATNAVTKQVTVTGPPVTTAPVTTPPANVPLVTDTFTRTVPAGGWGSADLGGAWTLQGGSAAYSVSGTAGLVSMAPSQTRTARLGLSATDAVVRVSVAADQVATGGAATATVIGRQVGASNYSARVRFEVGGGVRLYLLRDETALGSYLMPGLTYTPGTVLNVALSVTGTNPTTLSAKVWKATDAEPATWQVTATDTTAAMQAAGTVGLMNTVSGASTLPTTVFTWDDLSITKP